MIPLRSTRKWPELAVYDCEATEWTNLFLVCHVDEYGNRVTFTSIALYMNWLFSERFVGDHVFAHWGGKYDHRYIIEEAHKRRWSFETIISGGSIILVTVRTPRGREIHFCDSGRIMPDSVAKIGKAIGLPKLDVDRGHLERIPIEDSINYCFRDCDIVLKALLEMKASLAEVGGDFAYTLASMASRWVRRSDVLKWGEVSVKTGKNKWAPNAHILEADVFCEPAYFGGRCEVFRRGTFKGPLYYYDIRSSYPWSMLGPLPAYFRGFHAPTGGTYSSLQKCGISEATVSVPSDTYLPVLPVRHQGKLVFPTGTFKGRWVNAELLAAYEAGARVDIHTQALFDEEAFLRPFVENFYSLRKRAIESEDAFRAYAYKILLNSCYGKLVETVERHSTVFGRDLIRQALEADKEIFPTPVSGLYIVKSEEQGPFRHVAAGSAITASSRLLLYRRLRECSEKGGIYYSDTDSILTDVLLDPEPDELGNLKLEYTVAEAEIVAPKVYRLTLPNGETIYRCKGIPIRKADGEADESQAKFQAYVSAKETGGIGARKEGVTGFLSDIRRGQIGMSKSVLHRGLRKGDTKRNHHSGDSAPVSL